MTQGKQTLLAAIHHFLTAVLSCALGFFWKQVAENNWGLDNEGLKACWLFWGGWRAQFCTFLLESHRNKRRHLPKLSNCFRHRIMRSRSTPFKDNAYYSSTILWHLHIEGSSIILEDSDEFLMTTWWLPDNCLMTFWRPSNGGLIDVNFKI